MARPNTKRSNIRLVDALVSGTMSSVFTRISEPVLTTVSVSEMIDAEKKKKAEKRIKYSIMPSVSYTCRITKIN